MKSIACSILLIFLLIPAIFAQSQSSTTSKSGGISTAAPSAEELFKSMSAGDPEKFSLSQEVDKLFASVGESAVTENTEESVRSAVEGKLVVEEVIPESNREIVEAIDKKTQRYSPRLKLDFREFPLERIVEKDDPVLTTRWVDRLRTRLRLDNVRIEIHDRNVILSGTVPTEYKRGLLESMVRLEPGVDSIQNNLVVEPAK